MQEQRMFSKKEASLDSKESDNLDNVKFMFHTFQDHKILGPHRPDPGYLGNVYFEGVILDADAVALLLYQNSDYIAATLEKRLKIVDGTLQMKDVDKFTLRKLRERAFDIHKQRIDDQLMRNTLGIR